MTIIFFCKQCKEENESVFSLENELIEAENTFLNLESECAYCGKPQIIRVTFETLKGRRLKGAIKAKDAEY
ncbi:MAG: hypothetical protein PUB96_08780 [Helicobacteraceae bacterium]|nr:hypothetical protein [Helicobacteraceae bacterium]